MLPGNPLGCPAAASSRRAAAGSCLKYLAPSPSCARGSDHSFRAAGTRRTEDAHALLDRVDDALEGVADASSFRGPTWFGTDGSRADCLGCNVSVNRR